MQDKQRLVIALAGNPNCGKTTLFNSLTGSTAYVGNWPGVTVEKRQGSYRNRKTKEVIDVVDLPGIYSLSPYTPEEIISRDFIIDQRPDVVINVIDSTNLERNLYMTTQILEMDVPVVVALNMTDVLERDGQSIDTVELSKALGCPVVAISALHQRNLDVLMAAASKAASAPRKGSSLLEKGSHAKLIGEAKQIAIDDGVTHPVYHAIKALENDEIEAQRHPEFVEKVQGLLKKNNVSDFEAISADERYQYIGKHYAKARHGKKVSKRKADALGQNRPGLD